MQEEIYNSRDGTYSAWHRRSSTSRFVGIERAQTLAMIDLDCSLYVEYDDGTKEPIAVIETAMDVGQEFKPATVITRLAMRCVPTMAAYVVLYKPSELHLQKSDPQWRDIDKFRVKRLWPNPQKDWQVLTPEEWAKGLVKLRLWAASKVDQALLDSVTGIGTAPESDDLSRRC